MLKWREMKLKNPFRKYPELKSGIINLKSGTVFRGVIYKISSGFFIIRNAEILQDRGSAVNKLIDGEIILIDHDIDFIQVL
jgi:hypothetical protein